MAGQIPDDLELSLQIALRMIDQSKRRDYAGKLPDDRDRGARRINAIDSLRPPIGDERFCMRMPE